MDETAKNKVERRYKAVRIPPDKILDLINVTGIVGKYYKHISFESLEGARAVDVHYDYARGSFFIILKREDWPVVPDGETIPVVEGIVSIVQVKLAEL